MEPTFLESAYPDVVESPRHDAEAPKPAWGELAALLTAYADAEHLEDTGRGADWAEALSLSADSAAGQAAAPLAVDPGEDAWQRLADPADPHWAWREGDRYYLPRKSVESWAFPWRRFVRLKTTPLQFEVAARSLAERLGKAADQPDLWKQVRARAISINPPFDAETSANNSTYPIARPDLRMTAPYLFDVMDVLWRQMAGLEALEGGERDEALAAMAICHAFVKEELNDLRWAVGQLQDDNDVMAELHATLAEAMRQLDETVALLRPPPAANDFRAHALDPSDDDDPDSDDDDDRSPAQRALARLNIKIKDTGELMKKTATAYRDSSAGPLNEILTKVNALTPSKEDKEKAKFKKRADALQAGLKGMQAYVKLGNALVTQFDKDKVIPPEVVRVFSVVFDSSLKIAQGSLTVFTAQPAGIGLLTGLPTVIEGIMQFWELNEDLSATQKEDPHQTIMKQIGQLSELVEAGFDDMRYLLRGIRRTMAGEFAQIHRALDDIYNRQQSVQREMKSIHSKIDALFKEPYLKRRFEALNFHNTFGDDMNPDLVKGHVMAFEEWALSNSDRRANQRDDRTLPEQLKSTVDGGFDVNIKIIADYARDELGLKTVSSAHLVHPLVWADGALTLIEFAYRTPEFAPESRQVRMLDEIARKGRDINTFVADCVPAMLVRSLDRYVAAIKQVDAAIKTCVNEALGELFGSEILGRHPLERSYSAYADVLDGEYTKRYARDVLALLASDDQRRLVAELGDLAAVIATLGALTARLALIDERLLADLERVLWGKEGFEKYEQYVAKLKSDFSAPEVPRGHRYAEKNRTLYSLEQIALKKLIARVRPEGMGYVEGWDASFDRISTAHDWQDHNQYRAHVADLTFWSDARRSYPNHFAQVLDEMRAEYDYAHHFELNVESMVYVIGALKRHLAHFIDAPGAARPTAQHPSVAYVDEALGYFKRLFYDKTLLREPERVEFGPALPPSPQPR